MKQNCLGVWFLQFDNECLLLFRYIYVLCSVSKRACDQCVINKITMFGNGINNNNNNNDDYNNSLSPSLCKQLRLGFNRHSALNGYTQVVALYRLCAAVFRKSIIVGFYVQVDTRCVFTAVSLQFTSYMVIIYARVCVCVQVYKGRTCDLLMAGLYEIT